MMPAVRGNERDRLDSVFGALADPVRRHIVARLARGACTVSELAVPFPISAPAVSKHLNMLERTGLISRCKQGRTQVCRLEPEALQRAASWIEHQRAFWQRQLDQLEGFLRREEDASWATPPSRQPPRRSGSGADSQPRRKGSSKPGRSRNR